MKEKSLPFLIRQMDVRTKLNLSCRPNRNARRRPSGVIEKVISRMITVEEVRREWIPSVWVCRYVVFCVISPL